MIYKIRKEYIVICHFIYRNNLIYIYKFVTPKYRIRNVKNRKFNMLKLLKIIQTAFRMKAIEK